MSTPLGPIFYESDQNRSRFHKLSIVASKRLVFIRRSFFRRRYALLRPNVQDMNDIADAQGVNDGASPQCVSPYYNGTFTDLVDTTYAPLMEQLHTHNGPCYCTP